MIGARQLPELVHDGSGEWDPMRSTGMRRNLRAVLAGSLLFGGLTTVSLAAVSVLSEGTASAKGSCAPVNPRLVSGLEGPYAIALSGPDLFVTNTVYPGTVGEYTTSGATVNATLISGLNGNDNGPYGIAVSGPDIFVINPSTDGVGEYTTSGATINASLISGLNGPVGIAVSGSDIFVTTHPANTKRAGTVGEYTTSGATVNASLISGLNAPYGIAVSGSDVFVLNASSPGTVGEYTTSGATVNASLISGLNGPAAIAVSGSDLFVTNTEYPDTVGEYTTSGATIDASLISGLSDPLGIAVSGSDSAFRRQPRLTRRWPSTTTPLVRPSPPSRQRRDRWGRLSPSMAANLLGATSVTFNGVAGTI